jgi:hypothetical protein
VVDKDTQEKIDVVKSRLIRNYGYNEICATDVLNFVASIFARGESTKASRTRYIIHDVTATRGRRDTFFRPRDGGTKISSAYSSAQRTPRGRHYNPDEWNIYLFHFSDGDNWVGFSVTSQPRWDAVASSRRRQRTRLRAGSHSAGRSSRGAPMACFEER